MEIAMVYEELNSSGVLLLENDEIQGDNSNSFSSHHSVVDYCFILLYIMPCVYWGSKDFSSLLQFSLISYSEYFLILIILKFLFLTLCLIN